MARRAWPWAAGRSPRHRSRLAWELLERLSQQLSSGPALPLCNAMGPKLTSAPPKGVAMDRLDNGCRRYRGGSEGDSGVFTNQSPSPPPKNRLNIFKFIHSGIKQQSRKSHGWKKSPTRGDTDARVSGLSRSTSCRSKSTQSQRSSQLSPVHQNQEVVGIKRSPNSTRVTRRSVEASPPRSTTQRSSPRSTQLTRSTVLRSSAEGQLPVVAAACKTSPEIRRRPDVKDIGHPQTPPTRSEPEGLKGIQSVSGAPVLATPTGPSGPSPHPPPPPPLPPLASPAASEPQRVKGIQSASGGMQSPHGDGLANKIPPSKATQSQAAPRGPVSPGPFDTLPKPRQKMKTFNWTKVPDTLVCGGNSIWSDVTKEAQEEHVERKLNFKQVEELFCQRTATTAQLKVSPEKKKREPAFLSLLDGKRSLNVCIFLKQFKSGPEQIVDMIRSCKSKEIGAERLRMLQKILPDPGELSMLRSYTGDRSKLGHAEQFFLMLGDLRLYALYVDGMLQMEEFRPSVDALKPQLDNYIGVCQEILTNRSLKEFLKLILITGNFINSGSYAGNAFGFRLNTLPKLLDIRSNKPRMTLLHFLVEIAEKEQAETLSFTKDLLHLTECSRLSLDGMRTELKQLSTGIEKLERHLPQGDDEFKQHFGAFVTTAKAQLGELSSSLGKIGQLSRRLAEHFCEEESRFSVEECLHIFNNFCEKVKLAQKENEERRQLEERAEKLKITRMGEEQSKPRNAKKPDSSSVEEGCLVDRLLAEIRQGSFKLRKTPA
ncbi:hypothetical protein HPB51_007671 [Rhipicephalus microplus]|uniref:Rhoa gtpase effector dia/diaphanous n=1 Tax=Rhipicephalus microplus TaxID=6941 RepID=A0A9J6DT02_RHIMP|nr:hypothetical protein HPB51_007671 [Rhipicephalus microplus]